MRAMAAGLGLAEMLGRPFEVLWEPYDGAATSWSDLFEQPQQFAFISSHEAKQRGVVSVDLPLYFSESERLITLRGYDIGEQCFINEVVERAKEHPSRLVVIGAGNFFHPMAKNKAQLDSLTQSHRIRLLQMVRYRSPIKALAKSYRPANRFLGLHLRGSDRRKEAASPARLMAKAIALAKRRRLNDIFVCADSVELRAQAANRLREEGFEVFLDDFLPSRGNVEGEIHAVADFINLQHASAIVGPEASTFSTEAALQLPASDRHLLSRRSTGSARLDRWIRRRFGDSSGIW